MPTTVYALPNTKISGDKLFAVADVNAISDAVELIGVYLAELHGGGCFLSTDFNGTAIPSALSIEVSAGTGLVGGANAKKVVRKSGTTTVTGLTANSTNYVYLQRAGTFTSNTTGTTPANSILVLSCVTDADDVTSVNNNPTGRVNLAGQRDVVTFDAHDLTLAARSANYRVELNFIAHGTFGDVCYAAMAVADGAGVIVQEETGQKTTGKTAFVLFVESDAVSGTYGAALDVRLVVTLAGYGWSAATNGPFAGTWSAAAEVA